MNCEVLFLCTDYLLYLPTQSILLIYLKIPLCEFSVRLFVFFIDQCILLNSIGHSFESKVYSHHIVWYIVWFLHITVSKLILFMSLEGFYPQKYRANFDSVAPLYIIHSDIPLFSTCLFKHYKVHHVRFFKVNYMQVDYNNCDF